MKGLLIKDLCSMMKQTKYFFILAVGMAFLQNDFLFSYIIVYAASLPITALAYDERAKWGRMEETLPLTRTQIIGSKYAMGYITVAVSLLIVFCGRLFGAVVYAMPFHMENMFAILIIACIALVVQAVNLPLMFWIGVERGRLLFILIVVSSAFAIVSIWEDMGMNQALLNFPFVLAVVVGITVVLNILSFLISERMYNRNQ